jgi:hypothetical protein
MKRRGGERLAWVVFSASVVFLGLADCTANPHFIGDVCPGAPEGASGCVTFAVGLDRSGVSLLGLDLELPAGPLRPVERLRGETAMDGVWTADVGDALTRDRGAPAFDLEAPFTDDTRAVGLAADAASYVAPASATGSVGLDDFAVEVVLRAAAGATVIDKRAGAVGWALRARPDGALGLALADAAQHPTIEIASEPLIEGAWYHCLFWASRADGGRADCNGRAGAAVDLSALGDLDGPARAAAGGGGAGARVALLALYRAPRGGLGAAARWGEVSAKRFAALAGAGAGIALGSATPAPGLRDSPAYLDLQASADAPRRLFLVGPDWPRVACRLDAARARDCGYLSEPRRTRLVPADAHDFGSTEVAVLAAQAPFADGETRMEGLVPSTANALHRLTAVSAFDAAHHVFSFFARAGASSRVGASAGDDAAAIFDLRAGSVVSAPADVDARIEAWGDGLFRCAYGFDAVPGPTTYTLLLLDPAASASADGAFVGDGVTPAVHVAGLQVDVGLRAPASLMGGDVQAADHLVFAADDGNLPPRTIMSFGLRVIAPAAARPTDQPILNLNRAGTSEDQVQLFVAGNTGRLKFLGVGRGVTRWTLEHQTPLDDGQRHVIEAAWSGTSAQVAINGVVDVQPSLVASAWAFAPDQIDVAFSPQSSDHLEGLVAGLRISTP